MTMKLTITNDDQQRTALVTTLDAASPNETRELAPGQSAEFYVHSTRELVIKEKRLMLVDDAWLRKHDGADVDTEAGMPLPLAEKDPGSSGH